MSSKKMTRGCILPALLLSSSQLIPAQTLTVDAKANIYAAGSATAWNGVLPASTSFTAGAGKVLTFRSITGTVNCRAGVSAGPDGSAACGAGTNLANWGAVSGIKHATRAMFLVGVFLDNTAPTGWGPPIADYSADNFASTAPLIGQVFFIGDGLTGTGSGAQQRFQVPYGATRLYLGFAKGVNFSGGVGDYATGSGSLTAIAEIADAAASGASPLLVDGRAYLMRAGHPTMTGGLPPPFVRFNAAPGQMVTFSSVTGSVRWGGGTADPDGNIGNSLDVASKQGIAGVIAKYSAAFLAGVFLDDSEPRDPAPDRLTFNQPFDFASTAPKIAQIFYIGDGLTGHGTGQKQQFLAPPTATQLYLGLVWQTSWANTTPAATWEATGSYTAAFEISTAPPVNCSYALGAPAYAAGVAGGSSSVQVTTQAGCAWTAASGVPWITIQSGSSGNGSGTVTFTVAASTATSQRTGALTIAGQTFTVTQAGVAPVCAYSVSAAGASVGATGGAGSVAVTAPGGCAWTAVSSASWIVITSGASGSGNGTVRYTVAQNTAATARDATLTIAGQTHTVSQLGAGGGVAPGGPVISPDGIVNTADFTPNFSPGVIVAIFGADLAPALQVSPPPPLPVSLQGTSVEALYDNRVVSLPLFFVSAGQVNAQLPFDVPLDTIQVRVRSAKGVSETATIHIDARNPRMFTIPSGGRGSAALLHGNYALVSDDAPANPGEWLILYLTGLGAVTPAIAAGRPAGDGAVLGPFNAVPTAAVQVSVNGQPANIYFAGLAPGFAGLYQINFQMPAAAGTGVMQIMVTASGSDSQMTVTFACRTAWKMLASSTIGPAGGTLTSGKASLTFAPGARTRETPIRLQQAPAGSLRYAGQVEETFAISGLPAVLGAPVTFSLDITGTTLPQGDVYIYFQPFGEDASATPYQATVAGNRLSVNLGPDSAVGLAMSFGQAVGPKASDAPIDMPTAPLRVVGEMRERSSPQNHFRILSPYRMATDALAAALDEAHSQIVQMAGGNLQALIRLTMNTDPIRVQLADLPSGWGRVTWFGKRDKTGAITRTAGLTINPRILTDDPKLIRARAAHLVARLVARWFDPRPAAEQTGRWLWLDEAVANWFERRIAGTAHVPENALKYNHLTPASGASLELLDGQWNMPDYAVARGGGAAQFIEQLGARFPDGSWLGNLWELKQLPSGGAFGAATGSQYSPVEALQRIVPDLSVLWLEFCQRYVQGTIYSDAAYMREVKLAVDRRSLSDRVTLNTLTDLPKTLTWNAPDLSARFYSIIADESKFKDVTLRFSLDSSAGRGGAASAVIYKDSLNGSEQLAMVTGGSYVEIDKIGSMLDVLTSLRVMVVNGRAVAPYDETALVTLRIEAKGVTKASGQYSGGFDPDLLKAALNRMDAKGLNANFDGGTITVTIYPDNSISCSPSVTFTGSYTNKTGDPDEYKRVAVYTLHDVKFAPVSGRIDGKYTESSSRTWRGNTTDYRPTTGDWYAVKQSDGSYLLYIPNGEPPTWGDIQYRLR